MYVRMGVISSVREIVLFHLMQRLKAFGAFGSQPLRHSNRQGIQQSGCSDTSFVTRIGIPALCSLGIQGSGAHSLDEYAIPSSLLTQCKKLVATILAM